MFGWRNKKSEKEQQKEFEALFRSYGSEPILSIARLGGNSSMETADVDLVFVLLDCKELQQFASLASLAIRVGVEMKLDLLANAGGLLQFAVGPRSDGVDTVRLRSTFVSEISNTLGLAARIAFGRLPCHVGVVGTTQRKTWGCFPVAMTEVLRKLVSANAGATVELDAAV